LTSKTDERFGKSPQGYFVITIGCCGTEGYARGKLLEKGGSWGAAMTRTGPEKTAMRVIGVKRVLIMYKKMLWKEKVNELIITHDQYSHGLSRDSEGNTNVISNLSNT
jgi:hypothetical protein